MIDVLAGGFCTELVCILHRPTVAKMKRKGRRESQFLRPAAMCMQMQTHIARGAGPGIVRGTSGSRLPTRPPDWLSTVRIPVRDAARSVITTLGAATSIHWQDLTDVQGTMYWQRLSRYKEWQRAGTMQTQWNGEGNGNGHRRWLSCFADGLVVSPAPFVSVVERNVLLEVFQQHSEADMTYQSLIPSDMYAKPSLLLSREMSQACKIL